MYTTDIWAEAGPSWSRSLLNVRSRSRSLYSFQFRSRSLGYEAEARLIYVFAIRKIGLQSRSFGKPRSRSLWKSGSRSRSQALKNLGSRSLDPKKAGFVKPKPMSGILIDPYVWHIHRKRRPCITLECGVNWTWLSHNLCDTIDSGLNFTRVDHFWRGHYPLSFTIILD